MTFTQFLDAFITVVSENGKRFSDEMPKDVAEKFAMALHSVVGNSLSIHDVPVENRNVLIHGITDAAAVQSEMKALGDTVKACCK